MRTGRDVPLGPLAERYWVESRQPLASLAFLAPLLIAYEAGVLLGVQNGADAFMRWLLGAMGFGQHFLLPFLMVCALLGWHHLSHDPWRLSAGVISGMAVECVMLGVGLRLLALVQHMLFQAFSGPVIASISDGLKYAVGFLGAGIYEELLFRLILMSLLAWALRRMGTTRRASLAMAILANSLIFAVAHYVGGNEAFAWLDFVFVFRFLAGVFFSVLFVFRGFGIAAGSHAAYDILVALC